MGSDKRNVIFRAIAWLVGLGLLWRIPLCGQRDEGPAPVAAGEAPLVTVIIPARDEALRLPALLRSLVPQMGPGTQVLVVDDHSTDSTATVARSFGVDVIAVGEPPPGWTGKTWACWTGVRASSGSTLVFLDADTVLSPGGLARLVREQAQFGGLLSLQPYHVMSRTYERLSAFFNVIMMMGTLAFTVLGTRLVPRAAFGPCIVCSRDDYFAVGGHEAVRHSALEDIALAHRFARGGLTVRCLGGRGTISLRMYGEGPGHLVDGWTRNMAGGSGSVGLVPLALVACWFTGCAGAALGAVGALRKASRGSGRGDCVVPFALYVAYAGQLGWMLRRVGQFGWWPAAFYPIPLLAFLGIFVRSLALRRLTGGVSWRGRLVSNRQP